jgi:hypothetical protein
MTDDSEKDGVGYKRPPKHSQFQPGQSGNPSGGRKSIQNFKSDLLDELSEQISIRENGRERQISKQRAVVKALVAAALRGDVRATNALVSFCTRSLGEKTDEDASSTTEDIDIIEAFAARQRKRQRSEKAEPKTHIAKEKES